MFTLGRAVAVFALIGLGSELHAAPVTFFGQDVNAGRNANNHPTADAARNNFFTNLTSIITESFESFAANKAAPISINFGSAGTATLTGTGKVLIGANNVGQFPISGTHYFNNNGAFGLTFSAPIAAFGFYGTDVGDVGATLKINLVNVSNQSVTLTVPHQKGSATSGSVLYFGFFDAGNTYKSISFAGAGSDVFGFDDFSIGSQAQINSVQALAGASVVPEPASFALLGTLMLGLAAISRRTKR